MQITMNGKPHTCAEGCSLAELIRELGLSQETLIVERNREIVPAANFTDTILEDGDSLELLHFVGGG